MSCDQKLARDTAVKGIIANPDLGGMKMGDLAGLQVHKYTIKSQQYLLAYQYIHDVFRLTFIEHGSHKNVYRDLTNK